MMIMSSPSWASSYEVYACITCHTVPVPDMRSYEVYTYIPSNMTDV